MLKYLLGSDRNLKPTLRLGFYNVPLLTHFLKINTRMFTQTGIVLNQRIAKKRFLAKIGTLIFLMLTFVHPFWSRKKFL